MGAATGPGSRADGPLVGRTAEMRVALRWLEDGRAGIPRVGFVTGPPGVGKSRFLRVVTDHAEARGFRVLRGAGLDGTPPLLPMVAALHPLVEDRLDEAGGGGGGPPVGVEHALLGPAGTHDETAGHLAAAQLVLGAARAGPVLLALDDVHAVDDASAGLLLHVLAAAAHAAEVSPVHLVTVLSGRAHAGSPTVRVVLSRLRREPGSDELVLGGLHEVGVHELLTHLGPARPSRALARAIVERSGGNPLFARLLWGHLLESGAARVEEGRVVADDPAATQSARLRLDDVVDLRLDRLGPATRDLLRIAAVVGDTGDLDVLATVAGLDRVDVERLLAPAEHAGVCWLVDEGYRFDHPLVAAALSRRFSRAERRALHHATARALAAVDPPPALEVAAHLRAAGPLATAEERRCWGVRAARRAEELGAWGDAAAALELALGADAAVASDERLRLHLDATHAFFADHDLEGVERHGAVAVGLARDLGDLEGWCEAVVTMAHAHIREVRAGGRAPTDRLTEFLEDAPDAPVGLRARVLGLLAEVHFAALDFDRGREHARAARALAREAGDEELSSFVAFAEGLQHQGHFDLDAAERCFEQSVRHADAADGSAAGGWARGRLASNHWLRGDVGRARRAADDAEDAAARAQDWAELSLMAAWRAAIAATETRLGDAVQLAERALAFHRRSGYAFSAVLAYPVLASSLTARGDPDGAHRSLDEWRQDGGGRLADRLDVVVDALAGDRSAVEAAVRDGRWREVAPGPLHLGRAAVVLHQVEVGEVAGRPDLVTPLCRPLEALHARGVRLVPGSPSLVSRLCAVAATCAGDRAAASRWLEVARREGRAAGALAELARCDLTESRLLEAGGDRAGAEQRRARAAADLDALGLLGLLHRAERMADGDGVGDRPRIRRVILFTDLVGSTELNVVAGDADYHRLLRAHDQVVRDALRDHEGVAFKHTGDGVAAWFASAGRAVSCALAIHERLAGITHAPSGRAVTARCGLAAGEPIEDRGDLFGLAVSRAARICALADRGEVLVGEEVASMAGDRRVRFDRPETVHLRGFPGPDRVLHAQRVEALT